MANLLSDNHGFDQTCANALSELQKKLDFGLWMVTRADGKDGIILKSLGQGYGVEQGLVYRWMDSFCCRMIEGRGPSFAPDCSVIPAYVEVSSRLEIPIQAYMGYPLRKPSGELIGTLCAVSPNRVPQEWSKHESYVRSMVTKIEGAFLRDYEEAESTFKDLALAQSDSDNSQLHLSSDWDSLILEQETEAQESEANMSILLVRVNADSFNGNMAQTLHRIIGRSNHLSYIGKDLYAAILLNCNAPKLAAYVSMVRSCLGTLGVDHKVGHAVRNNSRGFQAAYDQAMVNVSQDDPLLNVA